MRPGRLPGTFIVVLLLVLGGAGSAHAQEDIDLRFFRPQVTVAGDTFQDKPFDKGSGEFGAGSLTLFANLPLGRTHVRWDRKYRASQFFAHVAANSASPDITFLAGPQHRLYSGVLAASGVWLSRANNLYVASAGESFAEDDRTIHDLKGRFYALGLGTHRIREWITLIYGGAATYQFGRGLVVPVAGVYWWINPKWSLIGTLPFSVAGTYRVTDRLNVLMRLGFTGNRYRYANDGQFPTTNDVVFLSILQSQATGALDWTASKDVSLFLEAGVVRTLRFVFSEDADVRSHKFVDDSTLPSGYLKAGARFTFGKSVIDDWNKK